MNLYIFSILFLFLSSLGFSKNLCEDLFHAKQINNRKGNHNQSKIESPITTKMDDKYLEEVKPLIKKYSDLVLEIKKIRSEIGIHQLLLGETERASSISQSLKKQELLFLIKDANDIKSAIDKAQQVFLDVEGSFYPLIEIYRAAETGNYTNYSEAQIADFKLSFAKSLDEYIFIRYTLETFSNHNSANSNPQNEKSNQQTSNNTAVELQRKLNLSQNNAQQILSKLGTPALVSKSDLQKIPRPELSEIVEFFKNHPDLLIVKLNNELMAQESRTIKTVALTVLQINQIRAHIINSLPRALRPAVSNILALSYNDYVLQTYRPSIFKVINTPDESPNQRLKVLMTLSSDKNTVEFLTTFARMSIYAEYWNSLKKDAKTLAKTSTIHKKYYDQMLEAESFALKTTWLNPFYQTAVVDHIRQGVGAVVFWSTLAFFIYYSNDYYFNLDNVEEEVLEEKLKKDDIHYPEYLKKIKSAVDYLELLLDWAASVPKP